MINKPSGPTSFQAVSSCRRFYQERKAGHTGTLDPMASGLMIVLLGRYTKMAPYCVSDHKHYHAEFIFGVSTDTLDSEGTELARKEVKEHSEEEIQQAVNTLRHCKEQIPPMYSAIKVNGRKLYELARKGQEVERKARPVTIYDLSVARKDETTWIMDAEVSGGTYIRTLIQDFGNLLDEFACMTSLVRTGIEHLDLSMAADLEHLEEGKGIVSPLDVLDPAFERVEIEDPSDVMHGRAIQLNTGEDKVILLHKDNVLAAYEKREDGLFHCLRGLF